MSYSEIIHGGRPVCFSLPMSKVKGGPDLLDTRGAVSVILLGHRRTLERLRSSGSRYESLPSEGDLELLLLYPIADPSRTQP